MLTKEIIGTLTGNKKITLSLSNIPITKDWYFLLIIDESNLIENKILCNLETITDLIKDNKIPKFKEIVCKILSYNLEITCLQSHSFDCLKQLYNINVSNFIDILYIYACYYLNIKQIKFLISQGANINCHDRILDVIIDNDNYNDKKLYIIQFLIENGVYTDYYPNFKYVNLLTITYLHHERSNYKLMVLFLIYDKKENEFMNNEYFDTNLLNMIFCYLK